MCIRDRLVASCTVVAQLKGTGAIHAGRLEAVQVIDTHQAAIEVKSRFFSPVSYTHLDVYKRQTVSHAPLASDRYCGKYYFYFPC